jgi:hypothetical protein
VSLSLGSDDTGPTDVGVGSSEDGLPDPDDDLVGPHVPGEWHGDSSPGRLASAWGSTVDLLTAYRVPLSLLALATGAMVASGRWGLPEVPEWVGHSLQGFAVGIIPASIAILAIVRRYWPSDDVRVGVWDPRDGVLVDDWEVPRETWKRRADGRYPPLYPDRGNKDAVVTRLAWVPFPDDDPRDEQGRLVVEGANPELAADPVEITAEKHMIKTVYDDAQEKVRKLKELRATWMQRASEMRGESVMDVAEAVEHGTGIRESDPTRHFDRDEWDLDDGPGRDDDRDQDGDEDRPSLGDVLDAGQTALRNDGGRSE